MADNRSANPNVALRPTATALKLRFGTSTAAESPRPERQTETPTRDISYRWPPARATCAPCASARMRSDFAEGSCTHPNPEWARASSARRAWKNVSRRSCATHRSGWVTAEYSMLPRATTRAAQREVERGQARRPHPGDSAPHRPLAARRRRPRGAGERTITVDCDVLQADGGTRTASITGGYVALSDSDEKARSSGHHTPSRLRRGSPP